MTIQELDLLLITEQESLDRCEAIIKRGVRTFIEVGEALAEIQQARLYRVGYDTFEDYCFDRWGIGRGRAYQLISAAVITREMSTTVDNPPTNEREARAIAKTAPADRPRVIERATEIAGDQKRTAQHIEQAAAEIAPPAAPDLADILLRLDAHGYAKSGTRQKGITTFYSFRDYGGRNEELGGEVEMAERELGYWLAELDTSAAYAQAKQERFIDARGRAERLGYALVRDGTVFVLTPAGQRVPALRGTLDQLVKTIEGYEKNAAKKAAASAESDSKTHIAKEHADEALLSKAKANISIGNSGDARKLLGQVQVSTWERDQLLRTLDVADARRFLADQRERLTRFSPTAMVSQTTWKQALDHIQALLEATE